MVLFENSNKIKKFKSFSVYLEEGFSDLELALSPPDGSVLLWIREPFSYFKPL